MGRKFLHPFLPLYVTCMKETCNLSTVGKSRWHNVLDTYLNFLTTVKTWSSFGLRNIRDGKWRGQKQQGYVYKHNKGLIQQLWKLTTSWKHASGRQFLFAVGWNQSIQKSEVNLTPSHKQMSVSFANHPSVTYHAKTKNCQNIDLSTFIFAQSEDSVNFNRHQHKKMQTIPRPLNTVHSSFVYHRRFESSIRV